VSSRAKQLPGGKRDAKACRLPARLARVDWDGFAAGLDARGYAVIPGLLGARDCKALIGSYDDDIFRSRIVMERHAYGVGEYKYFRYPLPPLIETLRERLYPPLAELANRWRQCSGEAAAYPATLAGYLAECHAAGQTRPTPLLLKYEADGYNCLHQDLYGALAFPLQVTVLLSDPGHDFTGGEFLLVEQRPRAQSRGEVVPLARGDAVVFAVNQRPVQGKRGFYRTTLRHGVSRIREGQRHTLGIIFHDAA
jgi:hypothetical protein